MIGRIRSRTIVLEDANIDTDQIIPARFLTTTGREGLGAHAFADWRRSGRAGAGCALDDLRAASCAVLVAGDNFGCGSSREHATWALCDLGIRAVISTRIADIFGANAIKNGLVPVVVDPATHAFLLGHPWSEVEIDVDTRTLTLANGATCAFPIDEFARTCLLQGVDELGYLLSRTDDIERYEQGAW